MYRLMQPSDWAEVLALWQAQRGDTEEFVRGAVERFAGVQNVYVAEENDHIEAVALAVPVTLQGRPGSYLFGLCGQGSLLLAGLVDTLCAQPAGASSTDARHWRWCSGQRSGCHLPRRTCPNPTYTPHSGPPHKSWMPRRR